MNRNVKLTLTFVLFYIFAFFAWWTYSLINLSQEKYSLLLKNEELQAKEACMLMRKSAFINDTMVYTDMEVAQYSAKNCPKLVLKKNKDGLPELVVSNLVIEKNKQWYFKERRKYLLEGVTMFLAIAAGVVWIFLSLGRILNLSRQQNNFLLSVSHELKTPITAIRLVAQTLNANFNKLNEETRNSLLQKIDANTDRLNNLIDQMLLLTRLEGANYKKSYEKIAVLELVNGILKRIPGEQKSHFNVITEMPSNLFINADRLTMDICLSNLIENALKYSPNGGNIKISASKKSSRIEISIADNGVGISEIDKKRVFEKFFRVGDENTRATKGTGLGLYLVKQILELHKGTIKVMNNKPHGAIFEINLKE